MENLRGQGEGGGLETSEAPSEGNWALGVCRGHPRITPGHLGASWPHVYLLEQIEGVLMPKSVLGRPDGWGWQ